MKVKPMPFAQLTLLPAPSTETAHKLCTELTNSIVKNLNKRHDLTAVLIETPATGSWTVGARAVSPAAQFVVNITAGTNTPLEKAHFITDAMAVLRSFFPNLNAASYIVVQEVAATDWGYDGFSQFSRAATSAPL